MNEPQINRTKIRIGLGIIAVVVVASLATMAVVADPLGKLVLLVVAVIGATRLFFLRRSLLASGS